MVGLSRETSEGCPAFGWAWGLTAQLFLATVLSVVLGFFVANPSAAAQKSAACEQYGCAREEALALSAPPPSSSVSVPAPAPASAAPHEEAVTAHRGTVSVSAGSPSAYGQPEGDPAPELSADGEADRESTEGPLPGYPYAGEPCKDGDCGL